MKITALRKGSQHGLKVAAYILISGVLAAVLAAVQSPELREAIQDNTVLVASIPVAAAVINILIATVERYIKEAKEEKKEDKK